MTTAARPAVPGPPDGTVDVHRTARHALAGLADRVRGLHPGDAAGTEFVLDAVEEVVGDLHAHQRREDDLLHPLLLDRCTDAERVLVQRNAEQHDRLNVLIATTRGTALMLLHDLSAPMRDDLARALEVLHASAARHQADEERTVLPLARKYLGAGW
jgi:hypothetical protein